MNSIYHPFALKPVKGIAGPPKEQRRVEGNHIITSCVYELQDGNYKHIVRETLGGRLNTWNSSKFPLLPKPSLKQGEEVILFVRQHDGEIIPHHIYKPGQFNN